MYHRDFARVEDAVKEPDITDVAIETPLIARLLPDVRALVRRA